MSHFPEPKTPASPARRIAIVTGITPDAERHSRPLAQLVREHILAWEAVELDDDPEGADAALDIAVCTDVWWLNNPEMRRCPTISVGSPQENALTAHLASRLPSVFTIDRRLIVQMDLDGAELQAACWGVDEESTSGAVDRFLEGYLDGFLGSCVSRFNALTR